MIREAISELLGLLESRECRLLTWGFYDTSFEVHDVAEAIEQDAPEDLQNTWRDLCSQGWTVESLLDEMTQAGVVYRLEGTARYRTRFAETVRLTARLRQMFRYQDWPTAPSLVTDLKLQTLPRAYPGREEEAEACWRDLEPLATSADFERAIFDALAADRQGNRLKFSAFQRQAFVHIYKSYRGRGVSGSVVSAGTGSGKTKAFYIPALIEAAVEVRRSAREFTKIVAVYPRNVLLADQLRELLSEVSKIRPVLERFGTRPISVGALLGDTPEDWWFERRDDGYYAERSRNWKRVSNGFVVPFLRSPSAPERELVWRDVDREHGRTCLYEVDSDEPTVPDGVLILTRQALRTKCPDILFLSLEMLNREMGNPDWAQTLGIGQGSYAPRMLLLDEVHSYEGLPGAQAAWVLRRWLYWTGTERLHVVGLSATLRDAIAHLSGVVGIPRTKIAEFRPEESELQFEGMEYNVVVKGDPASGTALLATSIQAAMLFCRVLTPTQTTRTSVNSDDLSPDVYYGRKVFGFTDNLDVLNRWYADMVDAEQNLRLARLRLDPRERVPPVIVPRKITDRMFEEGQIWDLPRKLGYDLSRSLRIARCSSQDPGVAAASDLIVATSSLEVGFDDPDVGGTLHHKRPRSMSSFIQRKGRAGRRRGSRPFTVIVLSDYGGDRWAFQHAEHFFQPAIDEIFLPITNPYVLRVQAAYFLIDWLGHRIGKGGPFSYLRRPESSGSSRITAIRILNDFLDQGSEWSKFRRDISFAMKLPQSPETARFNESSLDSVLWNPPRPLLIQIIPTLLRKLEAEWTVADPSRPTHREDQYANRPLPEFLPAATFGELDVADVRIIFPNEIGKEDEYVSVTRAFTELCPGHVSKRYSIRNNERGYWLTWSQSIINQPNLKTTELATIFPDPLFLQIIDDTHIYQPQTVELQQRPVDLVDSSSAHWHWQSILRRSSDGLDLPVFHESPWAAALSQCQAFLHRDRNAIEVVRYANVFRYEIRRRDGQLFMGTISLDADVGESNTHKQAIGYRQRVDGLAVGVNAEHLNNVEIPGPHSLARLRPEYFLSRVLHSESLIDKVNPFLADWLAQSSLAMLSATAVLRRCTISEAQQFIDLDRLAHVEHVLDRIFQIRELNNQAIESRLRRRILDAWRDPEIGGRIRELETCLWAEPDQEFLRWVRQRYVAALAQAFRSAATSRVQNVSEDDLAVDVTWFEDGHAEIYLTESAPGGLGQLESIVHEINKAPEEFHRAMTHALTYCDRESQARNLFAVAQTVKSAGALRSAFDEVRAARGFSSLRDAKESLSSALVEIGLAPTRELIVAVLDKFLRPGTSDETDRIIYALNEAWHRNDERLGLATDPRVFSYICLSSKPAWRRLALFLRNLGGGVDPTTIQAYSVIQQLLIPGCTDSCRQCLDNPNRLNDFGPPSRAIARDSLNLRPPEILITDPPQDWEALVTQRLVSDKQATLKFPWSRRSEVARHLLSAFTKEIEVEYLLVPMTLTAITRDQQFCHLGLTLKGTPYGQP